MFQKKDKRICLVTGGNRGCGLAIVKALAQDSENKILLGCRNFLEGEELAKKISGDVTAVLLDLSDWRILDRYIYHIKEKYSRIDVLINNAATSNGESTLISNHKGMKEVLQVNTWAPLQLIQAFIPEMIKNNYGRIVNISSGCGAFSHYLKGGPFAYTISKTALNALTVYISNDLPENVKINAMCPGWMRTRMGGESAIQSPNSRSPEEGAETAIWLANLDEKGPTGFFFRDKKRIPW